MTTVNMQDLQAKLDAAKAKAKAEAQQSIISARIALLDDQTYLNTLASIEVTTIKTDTINNMIKACEQVCTEVPVYNKSTRQERKWAGRYNFEFGNDIQLLYRLATGIMYSVTEHKQLMLAVTSLDLVAIESFVQSMGSPAYYSTQYNTVVESVPYNSSLAKAYATVLGAQLGLVLDTSTLSEDRFDKYFRKEQQRAELLKQEVELAPPSPFVI